MKIRKNDSNRKKTKNPVLMLSFIWHSSYMSTFRVYSTCIPINVKRCWWEETLTAIRNIIPNRVTTMVYFPRICFFSYLLRWQLNQILITSNMFELTKFGYTNLHTNTRLESQTQQVRYSHMVFEWIITKIRFSDFYKEFEKLSTINLKCVRT